MNLFKILLPVLSLLFLLQCSGPGHKKPVKLDRKLIGEQLNFGKKAAEYELWREAIFRWEKVVEADPNNSQATNNLAVAYESIGDYEKARSMYQEALELDEDSRVIRDNYKRFLSFYKRHQRQLARDRAKRERQGGEEQPIEETVEPDDEDGQEEDGQ